MLISWWDSLCIIAGLPATHACSSIADALSHYRAQSRQAELLFVYTLSGFYLGFIFWGGDEFAKRTKRPSL